MCSYICGRKLSVQKHYTPPYFRAWLAQVCKRDFTDRYDRSIKVKYIVEMLKDLDCNFGKGMEKNARTFRLVFVQSRRKGEYLEMQLSKHQLQAGAVSHQCYLGAAI